MPRFAWVATLFVLAACDCSGPRPCEPCEDGGSPDGAEDGGADAGDPDADDDGGPVLPCRPRPCNEVTRDANGTCVHTPADEGLACDDGDACTAGDVCVAGACTGAPRASQATVLGRATSYGAEPTKDWIDGAAAFLADDRVVFLESTSLTSSALSLVRVSPDGLERLDEVDSAVGFNIRSSAFRFWFTEPTTFLLPTGDAHFVVIGSRPDVNAGIERFTAEGDTLRSLGHTRLPTAYDEPEEPLWLRGAVARKDAVFVCGDANVSAQQRLRAYTLDEATSTYTKSADIVVPTGGCTELALSPDGDTLFVGANGGYRVYDVSDPTVFSVPAEGHVVFLPDLFVEDIRADESYVVARTAKPVGELADVHVFRRDGTPLGPIAPPADATDRAVPFGVAVTSGHAYVHWYEPPAANGRLFVARHALATPALRPRSSRTFLETCCVASSVYPTARGDVTVLQPWRRVLVHDGVDGFDVRTGAEHGALRTILPARAGADEVLAMGPFSYHRVDVRDPAAPIITAGGMSSPLSTTASVIATDGLGGRTWLIDPRPDFLQPLEQRATQTFTLLDTHTTPPTHVGAGQLEVEQRAALAYGGDALFQVEVVDAGARLRVRRHRASGLVGRDGERWPHDAELTIPRPQAPGFARVQLGSVVASSSGRDVLVLSVLVPTASPGSFGHALTWLSVSDDTITVVAQSVFPTDPLPDMLDAVFEGGDAFVLGTSERSRISRQGDAIVKDEVIEMTDGLYRRIVYTDDVHVMVARGTWDDSGPSRRQVWLVDVIDRATLDVVRTLEVPGDVVSGFARGEYVVLGLNESLLVVAPECGP